MSSLNSSAYLRSDFPEESIQRLNPEACKGILDEDGSSALASLFAAASLLEGDILDEDGQPFSEYELGLMLERPNSPVVAKITGLLFALSGEEFLESPVHFRRMCSSIIEGDVFAYEDDAEEPMFPDALWALYQASLLTEDNLTEELGERVLRYIQKLQNDEAEDMEARISAGEDPLDSDYVTNLLKIRITMLGIELNRLGLPPELMQDPELREAMQIAQSKS